MTKAADTSCIASLSFVSSLTFRPKLRTNVLLGFVEEFFT
jgi:hypothetical protein